MENSGMPQALTWCFLRCILGFSIHMRFSSTDGFQGHTRLQQAWYMPLLNICEAQQDIKTFENFCFTKMCLGLFRVISQAYCYEFPLTPVTTIIIT